MGKNSTYDRKGLKMAENMQLRPFQRNFVKSIENARYDTCALSLPRVAMASLHSQDTC